MEGLAETLREQQGLSDEAFRELQDQFNPQPGDGQQQGQPNGQQPGQGQQPGGESGQQPGQQGQNGAPDADSLAGRQQALRDELSRQRRNLPGQGTEAGERAADALGRAEGAMDGA